MAGPKPPATLQSRAIRFIQKSPRVFYNFLLWPMPLLRFIVGWPFYRDQTKDGNKLFSYIIWTSFNLTSNPVEVEIRGTWAARLGPYLFLALAFLVLDLLVFPILPQLKSRGSAGLPLAQVSPAKLFTIACVSTCNVLLGVGLQYLIAVFLRRGLGLSYSAFFISVRIPPRYEIVRGVAAALACRSVLQYAVHRWLLHEWATPFRKWHLVWQHSVARPFSAIAAYDHPVNHLLMHFVPVYVPAALMRLDVCTWYYLLIWVGLEDAFLYSGCSVRGVGNSWLMASRWTDAHFEGLRGNYGRWGVEDWVMGTLLNEKVAAGKVDKPGLEKKEASEKKGAGQKVQPKAQASSTGRDQSKEHAEKRKSKSK